MNTKAFTLIELIAVITIIAIMAGIVVYSINDWKDDANLKKTIGYANEVKSKLGSSLLAEWRMEEGDSNKIYDLGRFQNTGTISSTTNWISNDCPEGKYCRLFNGTSSTFITLNNLSKIKFKTICFWIKTSGSSVNIMTKRSGATEQEGGFDIYLQGGSLGLKLYLANGSFNERISNAPINDNQWHFVCISLEKTSTSYDKVHFIIDGDFKKTDDVGICNFGGSHNIYLGGVYGTSWSYGTFYMDDLTIFEDSIIK